MHRPIDDFQVKGVQVRGQNTSILWTIWLHSAQFYIFKHCCLIKLQQMIYVIKKLLYQSLSSNTNHSKRKMFLPQLSKGIGQWETRLIAEVIWQLSDCLYEDSNLSRGWYLGAYILVLKRHTTHHRGDSWDASIGQIPSRDTCRLLLAIVLVPVK